MKKILLLTILLLNIVIVLPQSGKELLTLDRYLIPANKKGAVVGKIITRTGEKVTLKDSSNMFIINKDGYIALKENISVTEKSPDRYQIILLNNNGERKSFELVKDNFIRNKVVAHRGAWKNQNASQNSMKSLEKAVELGCESSEFDVWLSSDNIPVLSHDPSIGGKKVEETTAEELFKISLKDDDFVPGLENYLLQIKSQNKTRLMLEVKASQKGKERCEAVADSCVQLVHRLRAQAWVNYITFNFDAAVRIRELDPTANILYLETDKSLEELKAAKISGIDYHFSQFEKDHELVKKAKALNLKTNVWTVNKESEMKTYINMGLDYITTDEPELLLKLVEKQ